MIKASYSASLFEQNYLSRNLYFVGTFFGEMIIIPIPVPFLWLDPSKYNFQSWLLTSFNDGSTTERSTMKSTTIWPLTDFNDW